MTRKIVAKKSSIDRTGLFASKNYDVGDTVHTLKGKRVSIQEMESLYLSGLTRISADGFQISDEQYIFLNKTSDYINHSCDPNCGLKGETELVALRNIVNGEELTYDYSTAEWTPEKYRAYDYSEWPMICKCNTPHCRALIVCFPYLPQLLQTQYIERGLVPNHIKKKLSGALPSVSCQVCEARLKLISPLHASKR